MVMAVEVKTQTSRQIRIAICLRFYWYSMKIGTRSRPETDRKSVVLLEYDSLPIQAYAFQLLAQIVHHCFHSADIDVDVTAIA